MKSYVAVFVASSYLLSLSIETNSQGVLRAPDLVPKNRRILEHQDSSRCLTVAQDYRLFLDKCNWETEEPTIAEIFAIIKSNSGGHLLKWTTGTKPDGIEGCLYSKPSADDAAVEEILLVECDPKNPDLSWRFENVGTAKYFVRQYPDGKCLVPNDPQTGSSLEMVNCDAEESLHVWRICEPNLSYRKCDI